MLLLRPKKGKNMFYLYINKPIPEDTDWQGIWSNQVLFNVKGRTI